jgi:hypothetical protein
MAVDLTLKGTAIANRESTPRVLNNPGLGEGAIVKCAVGYLASVTASLSITSVIRLVQVPSNAIVLSVQFQSGAQTAGKFDLGLYKTNSDGGTVVDADFFVSAIDCASAVALAEVIGESTVNTIAKQSQPLWQAAAGLSADPKLMYDVALTVVTTDVTTGTGAVQVKVYFVQ